MVSAIIGPLHTNHLTYNLFLGELKRPCLSFPFVRAIMNVMKNKNTDKPINKYTGNKKADQKYIKELMERRRRAFQE
jgi:hypothetical protein